MSALHDAELMDTLEDAWARRPKRGVRYTHSRKLPPEIRAEIKLDTDQYRRIRDACSSTVPSLNPDEVAARVSLTVRQLRAQASASGGGLDTSPAGRLRRRGKAAPPSPRTPTTNPAVTTLTAAPGTSPGDSPSPHPARGEQPDTTTGGAS